MPKLKTLEQIFKEKGGFEILAELPGKDLVGWTYDGPFDELPAQNHPGGFPAEVAELATASQERKRPESAADQEPGSARQIHRVVAWNQVGEAEGTGIVHIAPGCGKEDFQLGKDQGLSPSPRSTITESFCPDSAT